MKKVLFLVSHLGSNSEILKDALDRSKRVQFFNTDMIYAHPSHLDALMTHEHKLNNVAAIWADQLIYNHYFSSKSLYKFCKFIYFIRDPKSLNGIVKKKNEAQGMTLYYTYRLRRIYEMARRTRDALCFSWDHIVQGKGLETIENYLYLREPITINESLINKGKSYNDLLSSSQVEYANRAYERYYYKIKQLGLIKEK